MTDSSKTPPGLPERSAPDPPSCHPERSAVGAQSRDLEQLEPGVYDALIDQLLRDRLDGLAERRLKETVEKVDPADLPDRVGEVLGQWAREALSSASTEKRPDVALALSKARCSRPTRTFRRMP